jgi:hypothetical protein
LICICSDLERRQEGAEEYEEQPLTPHGTRGGEYDKAHRDIEGGSVLSDAHEGAESAELQEPNEDTYFEGEGDSDAFQSADEYNNEDEDDAEPVHIPSPTLNIPPPKRQSLNYPPSPTRVPPSVRGVGQEELDAARVPPPPSRFIPPPARIPSQTLNIPPPPPARAPTLAHDAGQEEELNAAPVPPPPPSRHIPPPPPSRAVPRPPPDLEESDPESDSVPLPPPRRISVPPPPPRTVRSRAPDEELVVEYGGESDEREEKISPTPPTRPVPPPRFHENVPDADRSDSPAPLLVPPPVLLLSPASRAQAGIVAATAVESPLRQASPPTPHEILDEAEGGKI